MTLSELMDSLKSVIAEERIGELVHLRVDVAVHSGVGHRWTATGSTWEMACTLFNAEPVAVTASRHKSDRQWCLLWRWAGGQTALVTIHFTELSRARIDLIAVGNHGVVRMEGGELFDGKCSGSIPATWRTEIERQFSAPT